MNVKRARHTATLLPNGKVLVAGGVGSTASPVPTAELYDPVTGLWVLLDPMSIARSKHTATLLPTGSVLVAGGTSGSVSPTAELYDPDS
jgi:hypothetical protein